MRIQLLAVALSLGCVSAKAQRPQTFTDPPRTAELNSAVVDVPLIKSGQFYFIDVLVNGQPLRFTLETGASFFAIGDRAARALKLPIDTVPGPNGQPMVLADLGTLSFGGATLRGVRARVSPMFNDSFSGDGLISLVALQSFLTTLDFRNSRLRLQQGELPAPNGRDVVAFVGQDRGGRVDVPIEIGGVARGAVLDTRSFIWLTAPDSLESRIPLAAPARSIGQAAGPALGVFNLAGARATTDMRLGGVTVRQPAIVFRDRPGVVIGLPLLEQLVTTIDFKNRRVRMIPVEGSAVVIPTLDWERAAQATGGTENGAARRAEAGAPAPPGSGQRTMGFNVAGFPGGGLSVRNVVPGSGADKVGLKENDQLVEFDGTPVADLNPVVFRGAAARGKPVKVVVDREGKRLEFMVEPYRVP